MTTVTTFPATNGMSAAPSTTVRSSLATSEGGLSASAQPCPTLAVPLLEAAHVLFDSSRARLDADSDLSQRFAETFDRSLGSSVSRFTLGLSPIAIAEAYFDWLAHIAASPGKRLQLGEKALRKSLRLAHYMATCAAADPGHQCIAPLPNDKRFIAPEWKQWPFNVIHQAFLLQQQWWHNATIGVHGVSVQHQRQVAFATRQILDVLSPANFVWSNPEVLRRTQAEFGQNLVRGFWHFVSDWERAINGRPPEGAEAFRVGVEVAATPGKVVFRNRLIELIQFAPTTKQVRPEPILIVPAWIMKYYILDLQAHNSLVKYLLDQGFTVFMISWKNPGREERDLGLDDYRSLAIEAAVAAISQIMPAQPIHAAGYCLGGTLLAIAAAALERNGGSPLKTITFLAGQVDFEEAGELTLFINEAQVSFLEDMMWEQGYLDTHQMAGAFQMIRSNDLVWSRVIHDYLMGERRPMFDLMAWNSDATRMPYRMHSQYLRRLFLDNDLAEGRYHVGGRPIALTDIHCPVFAVATASDHVAPWRSVYKLHLLLDTELTFLLTTGGHNAGIVSEPGRPGRSYQIRAHREGKAYIDPDAWARETPSQPGSWWLEWAQWLQARSSDWVAPPGYGTIPAGMPAFADAPGAYVLAA